MPAAPAAQHRIRDRLLEDVSDLPILPTAASRLLGLRPESPEYFESVVECISQDPGLSVKLLAIANSAALRGVAQIKTIPDAVMRLGARGVSNLVVAIGVVSSFPPKQKFEDAFWRHSFETAQVARFLARALKDKSANPDEAYLAGLLHDVGRFLLGREASDPQLVAGEGEWESPEKLLAAELEECGIHHAELGAIACDQWGIPLEISRVVRCHHQLDEEVPEEFRSLVVVLKLTDNLVNRLTTRTGSRPEPVDKKQIGKFLEATWPSSSRIDPWDQVEGVLEALETARKSADAMGLRF